jgi:NADP-reducing hydrogenase subunit HndB
MSKLSIGDLEKLREQTREKLRLRETGGIRGKVIVHMGTCGIAAGARQVLAALLKIIEDKQIKDINVTTSGCAGLCSREPMATIELFGQAPIKYVDLNETKIGKIMEEHILKGKVVKEYALSIGSEKLA